METLLDKSHRAGKIRYFVLERFRSWGIWSYHRRAKEARLHPGYTFRESVLTWLSFLYLISYLDRTAISVAAPQILKEFHLTKTQMGIVFAAFFYTYWLFQIPEGLLKAGAQGPCRQRSKRGYRNPASSSTLITRRRVLYGRIW